MSAIALSVPFPPCRLRDSRSCVNPISIVNSRFTGEFGCYFFSDVVLHVLLVRAGSWICPTDWPILDSLFAVTD